MTVDTAVASAIIDDNGLQAILPLLSWDLNTRWTFQTFAGGDQRINNLTLTVADLTPVSLPTGTLRLLPAPTSKGPRSGSPFTSLRAAPHRLVRMEIADSPFEFVAINPVTLRQRGRSRAPHESVEPAATPAGGLRRRNLEARHHRRPSRQQAVKAGPARNTRRPIVGIPTRRP